MADEDVKIIEAARKAIEAGPVLVVGSGASIAHGLASTEALKAHLVASVRPVGDTKNWEEFKALAKSMDLETSLQRVNFAENELRAVINSTWELIHGQDQVAYEAVLRNQQQLPLTKFFRYFFQTALRSLSVVTTNYDRLVEYSVEAAGFSHYTGFRYGYMPRRDDGTRMHIHEGERRARTVDIWKVHGSLDWFKVNGTLISAALVRGLTPDLEPQIITPGITKYQNALTEPYRSIITGADQALTNATSYLCVGYGFNDNHIHPKIIEKIRRDNTPIVVLAKQVTDATRKHLFDGQCRNYFVFEESGTGTKAYTAEHPDGLNLPGIKLWSLDGFIEAIVPR